MASIKLQNVTLDFPIYGANTRSLKRQIMNISTGGMIQQKDNEVVTVRAIDSLTAEMKSGEIIGLVGHNGAGKSTLLKILAGVYEPTIGEVEIDGKVSALLNVSLGMDAESTGYENIILNGTIRGLKRKEIVEQRGEIAEFTELGKYLAMPTRTYSTGMQLRLAFSIATSFPAQILLLDEVVGAGDKDFMKKAQKRLERLVADSDLVVFASHDDKTISKFCNKLMWFDAGKLLFYGDVKEGLKRYQGGLRAL